MSAKKPGICKRCDKPYRECACDTLHVYGAGGGRIVGSLGDKGGLPRDNRKSVFGIKE